MVIKCKACLLQLEQELGLRQVCAVLMILSQICLVPVLGWTGRNARDVPILVKLALSSILALAIPGVVLWLMAQSLMFCSKLSMRLGYLGQSCPSCGNSRWAWPVVERYDLRI